MYVPGSTPFRGSLQDHFAVIKAFSDICMIFCGYPLSAEATAEGFNRHFVLELSVPDMSVPVSTYRTVFQSLLFVGRPLYSEIEINHVMVVMNAV